MFEADIAPHASATGERLCIARGPWQLITLCASLQAHNEGGYGTAGMRTTLLLSGYQLSAPLRRTMEEIARQMKCFDRTVWIDDLAANRSYPELPIEERTARRNALQIRIDVAAVDEVWTANPVLDRDVLETFPKGGLFVFEDGIATYGDPKPSRPSIFKRGRGVARKLVHFLRPGPSQRAEFVFWPGRADHVAERAPEAAYLILAHGIATPALYQSVARLVDPAVLSGVLEGLTIPFSADDRVGRTRALVLSSTYSFWRVMPREVEAGIYADILARLDSAGYQIWWKEHPRALEPFLPELRRRLPGMELREYGQDHTVPLELYLRHDPVDLVVAGASTSLLYLPLIFGKRIRVASFATLFSPHLQDETRLHIARLVQSIVPALDAVIAQRMVGESPKGSDKVGARERSDVVFDAPPRESGADVEMSGTC
jgi:hypothetical protein